MAVFFALLLPVILGIGAIVIGIGNWYTHAKNLQSKVDAAAFAAGGVWNFPCGPDVDANIETAARTYLGPHTQADGFLFPDAAVTPTPPAYNPQVGKVDGSRIHGVLNGANYFDDDAGTGSSDWTDPIASSGNVCEAKTLDVKATEDNAFPLFSLLPVFPDLKRHARVEIQKVRDLGGLLPISVRVPKPMSAAAVFYNENDKTILDVKYFCEKQGSNLGWVPAGLGAWTTYDPADPKCSSTQAQFAVPPTTGVAIALSIRPACNPSGTPPITTNCFEDSGFTTVDQLCQQGGGRYVECMFGTGGGASQTVLSGLQFIRGYSTTPAVGDNPPELRGAWLSSGGCPNLAYTSGYFTTANVACSAVLDVNLDVGTCMRGPAPPPPASICFPDPGTDPAVETRTADNVEIKYTIVTGTGNNDDICNFGPTCDLNVSGTGQISGNVALSFPPNLPRYAIALRVRMKDTFVPGRPDCSNPGFNGGCEWYFIAPGRVLTQPTNAEIFAAPVQRAFVGDSDRSGPISAIRLYARRACDSSNPILVDNEAASQPNGQAHCFFLEMGLKGSIARDQDEPPIVFNLKASQSAFLDCDPALPNIKDEIVNGCTPGYKVNDFSRDPPCPNLTSWGGMLSPPAPYDAEWPPYTCVLTQTGNPTQLLDGFLERFFGRSSPAPSCPSEFNSTAPEWVKGRNYWHDSNNSNNIDPTTNLSAFTFAETIPTLVHGNNLKDDDPRQVHLFMTGYDSFGGSGNQLFPIWNFGNFYITGFGHEQAGNLVIDDPCSQGSSSPGAGNKPPADIKTEPGGAYVWGHFIDNVVPSPRATSSGEACQPLIDFMPCVAVLVE